MRAAQLRSTRTHSLLASGAPYTFLSGVIPGLNAVTSFGTRSYTSGTSLLRLVDFLTGGNVDAGIYRKSEIIAPVYRDEAKGMSYCVMRDA